MKGSRQLKDAILENVGQYKVRAKGFFDALSNMGAHGHTRDQFDCLRVNYLYRIETSPWAVSRVVCAALEQEPPDLVTAKFTLLENLCDEMGHSQQEETHLDLLVSSINIFGSFVHQLPAIHLGEAKNSQLLLPSAERFRRRQKEIYASDSYPKILGASFAQEAIARVTLEALRNFVFDKRKYGRLFDSISLARVDLYFAIHLDIEHGCREKEHEKFALENIARNSTSAARRSQVSEGCREFLDAHIEFFNDVGFRLIN